MPNVTFSATTEQNGVAPKVINLAIKQATELQLAQHEIWLALLHYKPEIVTRRFISQVDDMRFFWQKRAIPIQKLS